MPFFLLLLPIVALGILVAVSSRPAAAVPLPAASPEPAMPDRAASIVLPSDDPAPERAAVPVVSALVETLQAMGDTVTSAARKLFQLPPQGEPYREAIAAAEQRHGVPDTLLARVLYQESRFREDIITGRTVSPAGALGIAQFMPATAAELRIDPLNPAQAIDGAGRYLRRLYDALGDWTQAVAAYNWGIGNVQRRGLDAAPRETRDYIAQVFNDVGV